MSTFLTYDGWFLTERSSIICKYTQLLPVRTNHMQFHTLLKELEKHWVLVVVLIMYAIAQSFLALNFKEVVWDEGSYIGNAKYIFSGGKIGYNEEMKPPLIPFLIGIFWKTTYSFVSIWGIITVARLSAVGVTLLVLILTYILSYRLTRNKEISTLSVLLLISMPLFFNHATKLLTEIPASLAVIVTLYLWVTKKNPFLIGVCAGIAFLARFQMGLLVAIWIMWLIYEVIFNTEKSTLRKKMREFCFFTMGFIVVLLPYLSYNYIEYRPFTGTAVDAVLRPFIFAVSQQENAAWNTQGFWNNTLFYAQELVKENFFLIVLIVGMYIAFKKREHRKLLVVVVIFYVYFSSITNKQLRFLLPILPLVTCISANGIYQTYKYLKIKKWLWTSYLPLIMFFVYLIVTQIPWLYFMNAQPPTFGERLNQLYTAHNVQGTIITTFPVPIAYLDQPFISVTYSAPLAYQNFVENPDATTMIFTPTMIWCAEIDEKCKQEKERVKKLLDKEYTLMVQENFYNHPVYIYSKRSKEPE